MGSVTRMTVMHEKRFKRNNRINADFGGTMKRLVFVLVATVIMFTFISGCFSGRQMNEAREERNEMRRERDDLANELEAARNEIEILTIQLNIYKEQAAEWSYTQTGVGEHLGAGVQVSQQEDDPLFMSPDDFESIYGVLMHHSDLIDGTMSKAEAMGFRAAWRINRALYSGIMERVAYYAMFGEEAYIDRFRHRYEITLEQVQERILEVLARYNNDMTLDELNNNIIIAQEIYDRMGFLD